MISGIIRLSNGFHNPYPLKDYLDLFDQAANQIQDQLMNISTKSHKKADIIIGKVTFLLHYSNLIITQEYFCKTLCFDDGGFGFPLVKQHRLYFPLEAPDPTVEVCSFVMTHSRGIEIIMEVSFVFLLRPEILKPHQISQSDIIIDIIHWLVHSEHNLK